jgi:hypothetical protein
MRRNSLDSYFSDDDSQNYQSHYQQHYQQHYQSHPDYVTPSAFQEYYPPSQISTPTPNTQRRRSTFFDVLDAYKLRCNLCDDPTSEQDIARCSQCSYLLCHNCLRNLYGEKKCPGCRQVYHQYEHMKQRTPPPPSPFFTPVTPFTPITPTPQYYMGIDFSVPLSPARQASPVRRHSPIRTFLPTPITIREPSPIRFDYNIFDDEKEQNLNSGTNLFSIEYDYIPRRMRRRIASPPPEIMEDEQQ